MTTINKTSTSSCLLFQQSESESTDLYSLESQTNLLAKKSILTPDQEDVSSEKSLALTDFCGHNPLSQSLQNRILIVNDIEYEIGGEIARGSFKRVMQAKNLKTNRLEVLYRVLKTPDHHDTLFPEYERLRYFSSLSSLFLQPSSPYISNATESFFLAPRYVPASLILSPRSPLLESFQILAQISEGLSVMHRQNWIHCDVKLDNILIDKDSVKLADLGSACQPNLEDSYPSIGTPFYLPPEVGKPIRDLNLAQKGDIWAVGCLFYELLAAERFLSLGDDVPSVTAIFHAMTLTEDRIVERINTPLIPERFKPILTQLLAHNPANRPTSDQTTELFKRLVVQETFH